MTKLCFDNLYPTLFWISITPWYLFCSVIWSERCSFCCYWM